MDASNNLLQELKGYLLHNDVNLFSRRVLDGIADTQKMELYQEGIDFIAWQQETKPDNTAIIAKGAELLNSLASQKINIASRDENILVAENIIKQYSGSEVKLGPISLKIKKGQVYGLVGENGNGKTTLLRMLAKELSVDQGKIQLKFNDAQVKDTYDLRTRIIYIPQRTQKWYGSLQDNLKYVLSSYGVPIAEIDARTLLIIARLGLWPFRNHTWDMLSSGYKMRFELARTLLRQPEILLLDEPLANLDIRAQQEILEDLKNICNSTSHPIALILSSQQLYEVEKVSDKVIFLKQGQYQDNDVTVNSNVQEPNTDLIIELDCSNSKEEISNVLSNFKNIQIQNTGGMYILLISGDIPFNKVLEILGASTLDILYIRNISDSTRRFFL